MAPSALYNVLASLPNRESPAPWAARVSVQGEVMMVVQSDTASNGWCSHGRITLFQEPGVSTHMPL